MFGRIRASSSSVDSLDGSPSKILKDDSFSIYEATLMKLKLGAKRDTSASSKEMEEIVNDSAISSSCTLEVNVEANCTQTSASSLQHERISTSDGLMMMDTDCFSMSTSPSSHSGDHVSSGNSDNRRHNNASILHFFSKFKDPRHTSVSSDEEPSSTKNGCSGSMSSISMESHYRSEMESFQSSADC